MSSFESGYVRGIATVVFGVSLFNLISSDSVTFSGWFVATLVSLVLLFVLLWESE